MIEMLERLTGKEVSVSFVGAPLTFLGPYTLTRLFRAKERPAIVLLGNHAYVVAVDQLAIVRAESRTDVLP